MSLAEESERTPRLLLLLDLLAPLLLLVAGIQRWAAFRLPGSELPFWTGERDLLLDGPDAGAWAWNVLRLGAGDLAGLDPHRMPVWAFLSAGLLPLTGDVALSGHLLNRLLFLLLPPLCWGIARLRGGRIAGILAGILVLYDPRQQVASLRYGVDPATGFFLCLALLALALTSRRAWLSPLAGLTTALASLTHFTLLFLPIPLLLAPVALLRGWRTRLIGGLGALLGGGLFFLLLHGVGLLPGARQIRQVVGGGLASTPGSGFIQPEIRWGEVLDVVTGRLPGSLLPALDSLLGAVLPSPLPFTLGLLLLSLGVLGFGLRRRALPGELDFGLVLLILMTPIFVFQAVKAPDRYAQAWCPLASVLVARGASSLLHLLSAGALRLLPGVFRPLSKPGMQAWSGLAIALSLAIALAHLGAQRPEWRRIPSLAAHPEERELLTLGKTLAGLQPAPEKGICPSWELLAYAGLEPCLLPTFATPTDEAGALAALRRLRDLCGTSSILWIHAEGRGIERPAPELRALEDLSLSVQTPEGTLDGTEIRAWYLRISSQAPPAL